MTIRTTIALAAATLVTVLVTPTTSVGASPDSAGEERAAGPRTRLTFTVDDCEGCKLQLTSALGTIAEANAGNLKIWSSRTRTVRNLSLIHI